jgi:hypothetical protein
MAKGGKRKGGRSKMSEAEKLSVREERAKPNIRVVQRQDRFRHFHGDGAIGLEMTCAGRLMLVGAFDRLDATPEEALNALLAYTNGYWGNYVDCLPQMSDYQREVRGHGQNDNMEDRRGEWFDAFDRTLRDCGHQTRRAIHDISVDRHWFPDEDADWAARIINSAILAKRELFRQLNRPIPDSLTICGELASDSDFAMLELARQGIEALTRGRMKKAA